LILKELSNLLPSFMFNLSVAARLVHTRRALSTTVIDSHQNTVSDQATLLIPIDLFFFIWWRRFTAPQVPKKLLFLN